MIPINNNKFTLVVNKLSNNEEIFKAIHFY